MGLDAYVASTLAFSLHVSRIIGWVTTFFSTSHVIPHDRAMVLVPGVVYLHALQKVISVRHMGLREVSAFTVYLLLTYKKNSSIFLYSFAGGGD